MKLSFKAIALAGLLSALPLSSLFAGNLPGEVSYKENYRDAVGLFDRGMFRKALVDFTKIYMATDDIYAEGYAILCEINLCTPGYEAMMDRYLEKCSYSLLVPRMHYQHGLNLFDNGEYVKAAEQFDMLAARQLQKKQLPAFKFKRAYCYFETGNYTEAKILFEQVTRLKRTSYTDASKYALGYINYEEKNFKEAIHWFEQSVKDSRFQSISRYYLLESHFMLKDYNYVMREGPASFDAIPQERQAHLGRILSESYLVTGDTGMARKYYEEYVMKNNPENRSDYFYAGSLLYAVEDYQGAVDNYSKMEDKTDSLGQIANYQMGFSYIQLKNKVAAMDAFRDASNSRYNTAMQEDAYFNYAKLAFDLNNDSAPFMGYLSKYSDSKRGEVVYNYIALAAINNHNYEAAIQAYDNMDLLDDKMTANYMKANYLRAHQLIADGAYRSAIPVLKTASFYSDKRSMFNQMARYWMGESYYRSGDYENAKTVFNELYNNSALYGKEEASLVKYNLAWCYFKQEDYKNASKWFTEYLSNGKQTYRKDAYERKGDSHFMLGEYDNALAAYNLVLQYYYDADDIYPYYQAALCCGLEKDNKRKAELLERVNDASSKSKYWSDALYELGRTYVELKKTDMAEECFNRLFRNSPDSTFMAKSLIEKAMIAKNAKQNASALETYKIVVEDFPKTQQAADALLAIESIYQAQGNPKGYFEYIENIGKGSTKSESDREEMVFNAAEQIFLAGNYQKALASLTDYETTYTEGVNLSDADFYIAECYKNMGQKELACDFYSKVVDRGTGSYTEMAMLNFADISYSTHRYEDAYGAYKTLSSFAKLENNKFTALKGMMRSAYMAKRYDDAVNAALAVDRDNRSSDELKREAEYLVAKSYMATSRRSEAMDVFRKLSASPKSAEGAEASYILIQDAFDRGDFQAVEKLTYAFSDSGSTQLYWLAKSFITLGDSFAENGDLKQAKATFRSILDGYTPKAGGDEIIDNVKMRIEHIEKMN